MTIVDSGSWIEVLRERGERATKARVEKLLDAGEVAWCQVIRMELWRGARGKEEREQLRSMESRLPMLEIDTDVWEMVVELMIKARSNGLTAPVADVVIVATAAYYGAALEHRDDHLDRLLELV